MYFDFGTSYRIHYSLREVSLFMGWGAAKYENRHNSCESPYFRLIFRTYFLAPKESEMIIRLKFFASLEDVSKTFRNDLLKYFCKSLRKMQWSWKFESTPQHNKWGHLTCWTSIRSLVIPKFKLKDTTHIQFNISPNCGTCHK